jgi:hypothetical protein
VFGELPQTATPAPLHASLAGLALAFSAMLWAVDRRWRAGDRHSRAGGRR